MDLLSILPNFSTKSYTHILPPLERAHINIVDLITLDTLEIAKRAHVPPADVRRLSASILDALHQDVGFEREVEEEGELSSSIRPEPPCCLGDVTRLDLERWGVVSTLDPALDGLLGGGIPTGYLTEVTGESGSGKTQFLLSLLLAVQLPAPHGLSKSAIYISTEAALATGRLSQLLTSHPYLSTLPANRAPSLGKILSINAMDLESQEHILNYQLPVAIERYNVGLVVIDSITSNYRAEHSSTGVSGLSMRSGELAKVGQLLRSLAVKEDLAIVVVNQVSDRFDQDGQSHWRNPATTSSQSPMPRREGTSGNIELSQLSQHISLPPASSPGLQSSPSPYTEEDPQHDGSYLVGNPVRNEILSLVHQQRFFTGWGDVPQAQPPYMNPAFQLSTHKTPALGFVWSSQIACRIALKKELSADIEVDAPQSTPLPQSQPKREKQEETPIKPIESQKDPPKQPPQPELREPPEKIIKRSMKLVFAPWSAGTLEHGSGSDGTGTYLNDQVDFRIWKGGLQGIPHNPANNEE